MVEKKMAAPTGKVYAALIDPKWLEARCLALGELSASCKTRKSPDVVVTIKRRVRRELNPLISKVLNPESELELEEHWSADGKGYKGQLTLQIVGKPITVKADFELVPDGKGCLYRIRHHAKVNVPLIGGVVEKFILGQTEQGCADELDYLAKFVEKAR